MAGAALQLLRQPGAGALDTVWAEDGTVFLSDALRQGPLTAFATSYAGYYHAVPRLLGGIAALVPADAAAAVLAVEAALAVALLAVLVYVASAAHLAAPLSRVLVSAAILVVPVGQGEVLNSIANFHWYGLYALFWVLIWTPRTRSGRAVAVVVTLLVVASDILSVVFAPLVLWRAFRPADGPGRDRHGIVLAGALALGVAVHLAGLLAGSSGRQLSPDPVRALAGYLLRAVPAPLVGERWLGGEIDARWLVLAAVAWLAVGAVVWLASARLTGPAWPLAIAAALHGAALYVLPVFLSGTAAPRYAVAPALLVVTALVALLQPAGAARAGKVPLCALAVVLAVVAAVNFRVDNPRADGPSWREELTRARTTCAPGATAVVPVAPRNEAPPWLARIPCGHLT
ncbi:hypothetical protein GCE86_05560 [Micromonospora terminaliae]|uniref:Uncharacterized protein n=1 Tax=Micromonospora terminaliae TaxID=1914461 RepID=A0AAJ2ZJV7_9ACTN|nr:hypothetical protein [Micromonospora terminaliae]NES30534.1 hypothetical protein [Micromonospora terminaliae]QGL46567.1 hypothetical protein GCE86_05560 [Micromonospora terminaliae]